MTIRGIAARADGTIHGHVWLPTGECAAFIIEN